MTRIRVKNFSETIQFDYSVCEIADCVDKSYRLAMTQIKFIDFCKKHYNQYILGDK